jgi:preprotein translocase subunit YajC
LAATLSILAHAGLARLAQAATTGPTTRGAAPGWAKALNDFQFIGPVLLALVVMMIFSSRSRNKQEKQKRALLDQLKRGDRVQTVGGVLGNVVEVRPEKVLLKVDESNNTKVWFSRSAIHRVLDEESAKADAK